MPVKDSSILSDGSVSVASSTGASEAVKRLEMLFPRYAECSMITVECHRSHYSASLIVRAVEDCDAYLLNFNVLSSAGSDDGRVRVELRVSHRYPDSVCRSLERYGFDILGASSSATEDDSLIRSRYNELMHYLNI